MELTLFMSKVVGPVLLLRAASILIDRDHFYSLLDNLDRESKTISFSMFPIGMLMVAISVVLVHEDMSSVAAILFHLIAWGMIIKTSLLILFPTIMAQKAVLIGQRGFLDVGVLHVFRGRPVPDMVRVLGIELGLKFFRSHRSEVRDHSLRARFCIGTMEISRNRNPRSIIRFIRKAVSNRGLSECVGATVLGVDPNLLRVPNNDFISTVTRQIQRVVGFGWMAIRGKLYGLSTQAVKQATVNRIRADQ